MADVPFSSIFDSGSKAGIRLAPLSAPVGAGLLGENLTYSNNISTKTLVLDATGAYALSRLYVANSGTGGNMFLSMEIDGVAIATDMDLGISSALIYIYTDGGANKTVPIIINKNIKIWLQKTGATAATLNLNLLPLEA